MPIRDVTIRLRLIEDVRDRLIQIKKQVLDIQGRTIKLQVDGRPLEVAALKAKNLDSVLVGLGARIGTVVGVAAMAGGALVAGLGASVVSAADLEDAMIRVNKMIGLEGDEAKNLQKDVQAMMKATGKGLAEVQAAYETAGGAGIGLDLIKAGKYAEARAEITDFVKINMQAAGAFKMTTEATTSLMGGIANVYKPSTKSINEFLKSMASAVDAAADTTIASEEKIITALSHAGSAIAQFNPSDKLASDMTALSAAIISTNVSGDAAGEMMLDFLNRAVKDEGGAISQSLMMSRGQFQKAIREDPTAMIDKIIGRYSRLSDIQKSAYASQFGETGGKLLKSSESVSFQKALADARAETGKAFADGTRLQVAFDKSMGGFWRRLDRLTQVVVVLAQTVGGVFVPGLSAIADGLITILDPLIGVVGGLIDFAGAIPGAKMIATVLSLAALAAAIVAVVTVIGPIVAGFGVVGVAVGTATAFVAIFGGILAGLAAILTGPIGLILLLGGALAYVAVKTGIVSKALEVFKETKLGKDLMAFIGWAKGGALKISGSLGGGLAFVGKKGEEFLEIIAANLEGPVLNGIEGLNSLYETSIGIFGKIWDTLNWLYSLIQGGLSWLKDGLGITRAEKQAQVDAIAAKAGLHQENGKWRKGNIQAYDIPAALKAAEAARDKAPSGVFSMIALTAAINDLVDALKNPVAAVQKLGDDGIPRVAVGGMQNPPIAVPEAMSAREKAAYAALANSPEYATGGFSDGARFSKGGRFSGVVHSSEEIIPQAITQRGPGPLSRLLGEIYNSPGNDGGHLEIHAPVNVNVTVSKLDNQADLGSLANEIMIRSRQGLLDLQNRHAGYLRGGSLYR